LFNYCLKLSAEVNTSGNNPQGSDHLPWNNKLGGQAMPTCDVIVVGGGVLGTSIAYNLLQQDNLKVILLEKELLLGSGATAACTGGIRHQFSSPVNIQLTKLALPFFKNFEAEMDYPIYFAQPGYLFVTSNSETAGNLKKQTEAQQAMGVDTVLLDREELGEKFAYLNVSNLVLGSLGREDGYADPYGVVEGYRRRFLALGGQVRTLEPATAFRVKAGRILEVVTPKDRYSCGTAVLAAGAAMPELAAQLGWELPVKPFRRQVFVSRPVGGIPGGAPLTVDLDSGFYFHQERQGSLILGGTDKESHAGTSLQVDWSVLNNLAEAAAYRVPCLADAEIVKAYAGTRMMSFDYKALLGNVPGFTNAFVATGFSGHGFMHAPAAGLLLAELIVKGRGISLDLAPLDPARFYQGTQGREGAIF